MQSTTTSNGFPQDTRNQWHDDLPQTVHSGRNWLGWMLRNFLCWQPGNYHDPLAGSQDWLDGHPQARMRADALMQQYFPGGSAELMRRKRACEVVTYLDWLDTFQQASPAAFQRAFSGTEPVNWLDVGAKNWAYVDALYAFIETHHVGPFRLDGIELDPNRRYLNFQTRRQAALAHSGPLPHAQYHAGNVLDWTQPARVISHFLPFVFKDPHLAWGLPLSYFQPEAILAHLLSLLEPQGVLIIVNQGEAEAEAQQALLAKAADTVPILVENLGQLPARFIEYRYSRYGWLCTRTC